MYFFQIGKKYKISAVSGGHHAVHFFPEGSIVTCVDVVCPRRTETQRGLSERSEEHLRGYFMDSSGLDQILYSGDVVACSQKE